MKKKLIGLLLILLISFVILTGCSGGSLRVYNVTLSGHVEDFENNLVSGAAIYIDSEFEGTTDLDGDFYINYSTFGTSTLTIIHPDFITKTLKITAKSDGLINLDNDIRLMDSVEFSGSIKGEVGLGNPLSISTTNSNSNVKVMATIPEEYLGKTVYWIYSDIADVNSDGEYHIKHAKIGVDLTVIGIEDYNGNNFIEEDEFFGQHPSTINLSEDELEEGIYIDMTPE